MTGYGIPRAATESEERRQARAQGHRLYLSHFRRLGTGYYVQSCRQCGAQVGINADIEPQSISGPGVEQQCPYREGMREIPVLSPLQQYNGTDPHYIYPGGQWWVCVCGESWPNDKRPVCPRGRLWCPQAASHAAPEES